ncbi:membrane fusion protein (multidrug efflux system) [Fluviicoccus keumensis]|uniref:Membrane fusion protein (Multidrug efflux system) n=1 Tax=Fluviicoccus keumensis TaxID=1435465 RepID=A0A4Q7Z8E7_9GAMM|nr:efflux RND transporter periplasmic adaptor subunit [Fluviicoccus keumensis]RZU46750.1 membrane fusion protein (multidrug efflux system) [Fluviicoccus keumensis]
MRPPVPAALLAPMALAVTAVLSLTACQKPGNGQGAGGGMPPAQVGVIKAAPADVAVDYEYVGQVAGSREVEVRARVNGIVEQRLFAEGQPVKAGQPLYRLDAATYKAQQAAAEAALAQAQARVKQAERDVARLKPLVESQSASQRDLDNALSAQDIARADVKAAEARIAETRINVGYTDIRAPISGIAGRALKVEGALASAGGDSLLTTIAQVDPVYVNFGIGEAEYLRLKREQAEGKLRIPAGGYQVQLLTSDGAPLKSAGRIDFQDYRADGVTGSFAMRANVANGNRELSPGQFVRVRLSGALRPQAMTVPQRAVMDSAQGKFVYVVSPGEKGGTVALPRPVQVGEWVHLSTGPDQNGWVIRDGLKPGDEVIVDGTARIFFPGAPVVAAPLGAASAPAAGQPAAAH